MKIVLIQETKHPVDNRVALTPEQMALLQRDYPDDRFVVQSCDLRAYSDEQYRAAGIPVVDDVSDCDVLMGIKEVCLRELLGHFGYRHRSADTGDDILALCVVQELAHELLLACCRVSREGNACSGIVVEVAEYHRHDSNRGAP